MKIILVLLFVSLSFLKSTKCRGTDQVWQRILVDDKQQFVREHPLASYWTRKTRPRFDFTSTGNWAGYTATWEIRDATLWLTSFEASIDDTAVKPAELFGTTDLPVPAKWFTGKLTVLRRAFAASTERPHVASATLFLIDHGKVRQMRHFPRMRFELPFAGHGLSVERDSGRFVVARPHPNAPKMHDLPTGATVHGLIDRNGFSINFTDESDELANSLFVGDAGNDFTILYSKPDSDDQIHTFEIKRMHRRQPLH